ncbi:unnamed protein product [Calypogeia fissa]
MAEAAAGSGSNWRGTDGAATIWKVHSALAFVQTTYAVGSILQKLSFAAGISPFAYSVYKDVICISYLAPLAFYSERGRRKPLDRTTIVLIVLMGCVGVFGSNMSTTFGISLAPAAYGSLIGITTPIFIFLISAASELEDFDWNRRAGQAKILGVLSAVGGAVIIPVYNGPEMIGPLMNAQRVPLSPLPVEVNSVFAQALSNLDIEDWQLGGFLLILAGFLFAVMWTIQAYTLKRYPHPLSVAALAYGVGALATTLSGVLMVRDPSSWAIHRRIDIISLLFNGFISSGTNSALQSWSLFKAGPVLLASYHPLRSFSTIVIAWLFLGEGIHLGSVLGLLLIISGLFLITWGKLTNQKEPRHPVTIIPTTLDGALTITADTSVKEHLLG